VSAFDYSGQWLGYSEGEPPGRMMLDLDLDKTTGTSYGIAYLFSSEPAVIPSSFATVSFDSEDSIFSVKSTPKPFDARIGRALTLSDLSTYFKEVQFPDSVSIDLTRFSDDIIDVKWSTDIRTIGSGRLVRTRMSKVSDRESEPSVLTWNDYKRHVSKLNFRDFIFRGQSHPYPLQTTFHRSTRKILPAYLNNDIPLLYRSITGRIRHVFNLDHPDELGAMLNLAQHHGFPTPLLDWSYSPFVAAWFAFERVGNKRKSGEKVRILAINRTEFLKLSQFQNLTFTLPHLSILEALAIENDRAVPQQGLLMLTNLQDVEAHIADLERDLQTKLLIAFDIPIEDARDAMNDLAMMGITRSTLMPGIESICLDLKDRLFT
jgi:FRG domain